VITKVVLAKLSPTMDEGTIVQWSKQEGDAVKVGDVLAEIETDKANMEMEALGEGILRRILVPAGQSAPVGAIIGVIAKPDEDIQALLDEAAAGPKPSAPKPAPAKPAPSPQPAARKPAPSAASAPVAPAADVTARGHVKASPLARKMAAQRSIPLAQVPGSGPGGRIIKRDIEAWSGTVPAAPAGTPSLPEPAVTPGEEIPLSNMRKTIARRLAESKFTAPHYYVSVDISMDRAVALREQLAEADAKVSFNDLVLKGCALALRANPMVNASWAEDRIVTHGVVDIGVAVALPEGLITPVVRAADQKSVSAIGAEVKDLAARAKSKKLKPEEFSGATFTVSNLGMYGVTEFTAIINPPGSAILAVGAVRKAPVVDGDEIRVGHLMTVTLSSDHRVIDGAQSAQFLAELRRLLENPLLLLL
jgi:pyruvate dehydrogenase E2 component (dihydrolipoyllysine-residue acetyltransferase)